MRRGPPWGRAGSGRGGVNTRDAEAPCGRGSPPGPPAGTRSERADGAGRPPPGAGPPVSPAASRRGRGYAAPSFTGIAVPLRAVARGIEMVSTPFAKLAFTFAGSTRAGRRTVRANAP